MTLTQNIRDDHWIIAIEGRLDANTSPELEETLKEEPQEVSGLIMDFADMNYISSAGLRVMLLALKQMNRAGRTIKVINVSDPVFEVFELTGFVDILDVERA